ncbi:hypothetical protein [Bordetella avium]|uniref:hypothetical protein n=1 Tax=Bordetella avium TaxID=521 RepID=UPI000E199518|nr:hypothetical protein [Bordetella avium]WQE32070.1 hypothetical protein U0029_08950 [Bordetella avium]SUV68915.1 N-isopropylammelide isopropyl amidohydrolase [Bordetella avium]
MNGVDALGEPLHIVLREAGIETFGPERPDTAQAEVLDLKGQLVLLGFVNGHIHLDKRFVGEKWHPHEPVKRFRDRLAVEKRELAAAASIEVRANALLRLAASWGTLAMRSHVDVDASTELTHLHAVMRACERWRSVMDIGWWPFHRQVCCPVLVRHSGWRRRCVKGRK